MKAIIIKEFRENLKWALLMLFTLLIAVMVWTFGVAGIYEAPLVGREMHAITSLGFPICGFAIGMFQILQDASMGRWAFLTHRPISRSQILLGKVTAGMMLYIPVTGLALLAAALWAVTPGRLAMPFDWHMLLPRISDQIDGTMWYAAGLLVAARRARWLRTRLFPAGLAILVSILAAGSNSLWKQHYSIWRAFPFF